MSVRNLDGIFRPTSIALIGATNRPHAIGQLVADNLIRGGFAGPIWPVNPHDDSIAGLKAYPDVKSLPEAPELGVICTPPATVPGLIADLGARGARAAIVITAGFGEGGSEDGKILKAKMLDAARPHLLRIVGPNCLGVISTPSGLNASFAHVPSLKGHVAFVAQSGAMLTTVLDWATSRGIGFSHLVSLGDMADADFGDMLDWLASDENTQSILLYVEGITQARKFMSAARAAARLKPVIAIKAGRAAGAAKAAASHTGALAGIDGVYDAAFQRAGILRVFDLDEVFDAVETLAMRPPVHSDQLTILTNGGGVGVLATDSLLEQGGHLAEISPDTMAKLNAVLPPTWSHGNPVDIIGDADGPRYAAALNILTNAPGNDAILVLNCPTAVASGLDAAEAVAAMPRKDNHAILTNWLGARVADDARALFAKAQLPTYDTPEQAVRGFMHLVRYARGQEILMEVPESIPSGFSPDTGKARTIVADALKAGETWLSEPNVRGLLSCYGIPVVRSAVVTSPEDAAQKAREFGKPVALKIFSPDITHKSDVGGVALDLATPEVVKVSAEAMLKRVAAAMPGVRLNGFVVQEMINRPGALELILGMAIDATFGPFLLFGQGGTAVEVIGDKALALPPLNLALAKLMMSRTRIWKQLQGYRDRPPADIDAVALTLVQLSQLISDIDEIVDLDINPLLADATGVIAVDARIKVKAVDPAAIRDGRMAIRPYPKELEQHETVPGIGEVFLRPVRPEDAPAFIDMFEHMSAGDIRLRFFSPLRALPKSLLARLTQIDYDRELAFVLLEKDVLIGVGRVSSDPDNVRAEFALTVRTDKQGHGLGRFLMKKLIVNAKARGTQELFGDVLADNEWMLALCRELGFEIGLPSLGVIRATLKL
ncbi:MAG: bifunctional acetate--CoA ligase family protein/GNAT family N-acetyltransferase [Rhizomicrobium sp.]|jgi:acetyltransferase